MQTDFINPAPKGARTYELKNHLGNVLATVSDRKDYNSSNFSADITSSQDYYPFGMQMPGRTFSSNNYRYGFNGMEKDDEIKGAGNSYDFGARIYDTRLGRWLACDPMADLQPGWSTYKSFLDNPIIFQDPEGETEYLTIITSDERTGEKTTFTKVLSDKVFMGSELRHIKTMAGGVHYGRNWYDKQTTIYQNIDKDGNKTTTDGGARLVTENGPQRTTTGPFMESSLWANIGVDFPELPQGEGGVQKGGIYGVSEGGGADPTKFKALNDVDQVNLDYIFAAANAKVKSLKLPKNIEIPEVINSTTGTIGTGQELNNNNKGLDPNEYITIQWDTEQKNGSRGTGGQVGKRKDSAKVVKWKERNLEK